LILLVCSKQSIFKATYDKICGFGLLGKRASFRPVLGDVAVERWTLEREEKVALLLSTFRLGDCLTPGPAVMFFGRARHRFRNFSVARLSD
jgi:hypothetical protein